MVQCGQSSSCFGHCGVPSFKEKGGQNFVLATKNKYHVSWLLVSSRKEVILSNYELGGGAAIGKSWKKMFFFFCIKSIY